MGKPEKINVDAEGGQVAVRMSNSEGDKGVLYLSVAETWDLCHELGAAARQAQQHISKEQAARAGVTTSAAPKIGRQPED